MTAIKLQGVSHVFETRGSRLHALDGIDLEIRENEFVTLVGRSGCGKSTLLRIVAGLLTPTAGTVAVGGAPVEGPRRHVSFMFQRSALLPWRSVIENVMLPVEIFRLDRHTYRARAEELLALTGLAGFEDRRPHELSGGMQQRVALCRALVPDPSVLLMDEPFAALDALTREELSLELQRIWGEDRKTIVFVTHSIQEATLLADRIVVMSPRPGRLARTLEVRAPRPRSLGVTAHSEELDRVGAELHELLFARELALGER
ncbi:MAG TPA: ABC transporter ATP-binding protein [Gaiellaceae bacterium]|nr:ABC transporter ATP-binding protein [Gaiellaceae bacterium]